MIAGSSRAQPLPIPPPELKSGIAFAGPAVQAMQSDDAGNPAMLWVERGERLWRSAAGIEGRSCESCHGAATSMRGVATRYPAVDAASGRLFDLEARIDACRVQKQRAPALARESEDLIALTAFVAHQSRGLASNVAIDGAARAPFERARAFYYERHGQMNLACADCHDRSWGRRLYTETISQGHGTAFPAYRLEWQGVGSLERRLRACLYGIRAEMPPPGAPELTELALYLAWRAGPLPLEVPGVRR